jgi:hypothetical protein
MRATKNGTVYVGFVLGGVFCPLSRIEPCALIGYANILRCSAAKSLWWSPIFATSIGLISCRSDSFLQHRLRNLVFDRVRDAAVKC